MAGVDYDFLLGVVLFLCATWFSGRAFKQVRLPAILGEFMMGLLLGPQMFDVVPFASDGNCDTLVSDPNQAQIGTTYVAAEDTLAVPVVANASNNLSVGAVAVVKRFLAQKGGGHDCRQIHMWDGEHHQDVWSFVGFLGVTLLIMESGMHINFEKIALVGVRPFIVAIIGTGGPLLFGMLLVEVFWPGQMYPDGFAAGCALAPTSVGISIKLLDDAKMLNSMAGQTTLTAAFVDDVFSLVLLVMLRQLAGGNANAGSITGTTIAAFAFLGGGVVLARKVFPVIIPKILDKIPEFKSASIQPRAEVHLTIMIGSLIFFAWIGDMIGSPLLGAFVAGMCFTDVPLSHLIWQQQMKRILKWMVRIFFAATVAFAIPVDKMMNGESLMRGLVIGLVPGILMKLVSGVAAAMPYKDAEARRLAAAASPATCGGKVQPLQFLVGTAMIARGEFAFLVALQASKLKRSDDTYMLREEVYASVTWALMCALISAPFLFKWSLRMYTRAVPVLRGDLIGGSTHSGEDFVIKLTGKHHTGLLHDVLDTLHKGGLDIVEARALVASGDAEDEEHTDCDIFIVRPRGKQKDFDDEKLQEIKHDLMCMLGHAGGEIEFTTKERSSRADAIEAGQVSGVTESLVVSNTVSVFNSGPAKVLPHNGGMDGNGVNGHSNGNGQGVEVTEVVDLAPGGDA